MDHEIKKQFLSRFSSYLDAESPGKEAAAEVDLYRLFVELAALKTEVKTESRQVKTALDEFQSLIALLQRNNEQLSGELTERKLQHEKQLEKTERPFLLTLLDLRDRIEISVEQAFNCRPGWWVRRAHDTQTQLQSLQQGMEITLRRLDGLLHRYNVKPMPTIGEQLDPHCMQVSETQWQRGQDEGVVLADVRKGYLRQGQILRMAEVIVNKRDVKNG